MGADRRSRDDRGGARRGGAAGRAARRGPGVVRMIEERADPPDEPVPEADLDIDSGPVAEQLSEAQLEALLFVAERPLTRREIATLAGVDRATVDERLGDLEVALADRGIRLVLSGDRIRGVYSVYTIRSLLHRRLVVELGRSESPGRPFLYGTGFEFLERFGLTSLEELPPLDVEVAARLIEEEERAATEATEAGDTTDAAVDEAVPAPAGPGTESVEAG